ncbi:1-phosphatidylinositol-4-phosphate 5-kinase [Planoprotostelium fungivorum]|uniref:1-phosphatidylinositol-4-phosphate 5-kinase n=1 Tax=Planoprotostelium fungivorum TaxID=1890364 RepID=A0A2P6NL89_9EUKA|nr:1-phosphatidylinositol-4-phosphate 5-kinase [Planoprotostelium fungivorum]
MAEDPSPPANSRKYSWLSPIKEFFENMIIREEEDDFSDDSHLSLAEEEEHQVPTIISDPHPADLKSILSPRAITPQDTPVDSPTEKRIGWTEAKIFESNFVYDVVLAVRTCLLSGPNVLEDNGTLLYSSTTTASPSRRNSFSGTTPRGLWDKAEAEVATHDSVRYKISRFGDDKRMTVVDYSPKVYAQIRHILGLSSEDCLVSWSAPEKMELKASDGKSSSLFMSSLDRRFMIKRITKADSNTLKSMLDGYHKHLTQNRNSTLMRIIGHHKIIRKGRVHYVIVSLNIFGPIRPDEIYDLKGSKVGRTLQLERSTSFLDENPEEVAQLTTQQAEKDNDFLSKKRKIHLSVSDRAELISAIEADTRWLESHFVMDYSFLVGISKTHTHLNTQPSSPSDTRNLRKIPTQVYFLEDVLTQKAGGTRFRMIRSPSLLLRRSPKPDPSISTTESSKGSTLMAVRGLASNQVEENKTECYLFGIIDVGLHSPSTSDDVQFLQKYDSKKKIAHFAKTLRHEKEELSTVNPELYASRFRDFLNQSVLSSNADASSSTASQAESLSSDTRRMQQNQRKDKREKEEKNRVDTTSEKEPLFRASTCAWPRSVSLNQIRTPRCEDFVLKKHIGSSCSKDIAAD